MFFIALTFLAALLIEGLGTLVSVIGLSTLFGANPIIIALAVALDLGKIVVVSLLYTHWGALNKLMKTYALLAAFVTMVITSAGAAGYLSGEFQKAILGTQEVALKVDVLKKEQAKLEERKKQIDAGIAAIPDRYTANQKIRLMSQFKEEQKQVTARLGELDRQLPEMQVTQIGVEAKAGPILYVAKAFNITVEEAVKWVILLIIFVFDPLAIFLIIAGNFLLHQRRVHKEVSVADVDLFAEAPVARAATPKEVAAFAPLQAALTPAEDAAAQREFEKPAEPLFELLQPTKIPPMPPIREAKPEPSTISVVQPSVEFREPSPATELHALSPDREQITLSSLGLVKEDPATQTGDGSHPAIDEVGYGTNVYKTGHR